MSKNIKFSHAHLNLVSSVQDFQHLVSPTSLYLLLVYFVMQRLFQFHPHMHT